jgi:hypothetical protein
MKISQYVVTILQYKHQCKLLTGQKSSNLTKERRTALEVTEATNRTVDIYIYLNISELKLCEYSQINTDVGSQEENKSLC